MAGRGLRIARSSWSGSMAGRPSTRPMIPSPRRPPSSGARLKAMSTKVPGILVSELLPQHALLMDKMSIIRSMHHDNGDHYAAAHWMLTGYLGSNAGQSSPSVPLGGLHRCQACRSEEAGDAGVCRAAAHAFGGTGAGVSRRGLSRCRLQSVRGRRQSQFRELPCARPRASFRCGSETDAGAADLAGVVRSRPAGRRSDRPKRRPGPVRPASVQAGSG